MWMCVHEVLSTCILTMAVVVVVAMVAEAKEVAGLSAQEGWTVRDARPRA